MFRLYVKLISALLIAFLTLLNVSGCGFDSREIDHRSMIVGMTVDKAEDDQLLVSFQVPVLGSAGTQDTSPRQTDFEIISSTGRSVMEAVADLEAKSPRVLFFGHLKAVAISEEVARESIEEILDVLDRHPQKSNNVYLIVIEGMEAKEFMEQKTPLVTLPALYLDVFFKADQKMTRTKDIKVFEYIRDSYAVGNAAFLPVGRLTNSDLEIKGYAVFKNHRMVDTLHEHDVSFSRLLRERKLSDLRISTTLQMPNNNDETGKGDEKGEDKELIIDITRSDLKLKKSFKKTYPVEFNLTITGTGEVRGKNVEEALTSRDFLKNVEKRLTEDIKQNVERVIQHMQEINVEPYHLGQYIFAKDTAFFDSLDWNETGWKEAKFNISVDFTINNTGTRGVLDKKKIGR